MATEITAKGDLIVGTGNATFDNLPAGTNGYTLVADSVETTGLKWVAPSSGALTFITSSTFSNVASATIDGCFTSTYNAYLVVIEEIGAATATDDLQFQLRYTGPTTQTAGYYGASGGGQYSSSTFVNIQNNNTAQFTFAIDNGGANQGAGGYMIISKVGVSGVPVWNGSFVDKQDPVARSFGGIIDASQTWTGILFKSSSTNITGIIRVYGLAKS
jgi:hypothetical protein